MYLVKIRFVPAADLEVDFSIRRTFFGEENLDAVVRLTRFVVRVIFAKPLNIDASRVNTAILLSGHSTMEQCSKFTMIVGVK